MSKRWIECLRAAGKVYVATGICFASWAWWETEYKDWETAAVLPILVFLWPLWLWIVILVRTS